MNVLPILESVAHQMHEEKMPKTPGASLFLLESYRLTFFTSGFEEPDGRLFNALFGVEPSTSQTINGPMRAIHCEGIIGGVKYAVDETPQVVNIVFFGIDQANPTTGEPLLQVTFDVARTLLNDLWAKTKNCPRLRSTPRFAIGPVLVAPVQDRPSGYQLLSGFLPFQLDGATTSDFLLQVNKPSNRVLPNGKPYVLNAIVNASVAVVTSFTVAIAGAGTPTFQPVEMFRTRLQFDVNNAPLPGMILDQVGIEQVFLDSLGQIDNILENGVTI